MLFNSFVFLLAFLPAALILHGLADRYRPGWRLPVLLALSFAFYGWWDVRFVPLLALSIGLNWLAARLFLRTGAGVLIPLAIAANLATLAAFRGGSGNLHGGAEWSFCLTAARMAADQERR